MDREEDAVRVVDHTTVALLTAARTRRRRIRCRRAASERKSSRGSHRALVLGAVASNSFSSSRRSAASASVGSCEESRVARARVRTTLPDPCVPSGNSASAGLPAIAANGLWQCALSRGSPSMRRRSCRSATSMPAPNTTLRTERRQHLVQPHEGQVAAAVDHGVDRAPWPCSAIRGRRGCRSSRAPGLASENSLARVTTCTIATSSGSGDAASIAEAER